MLNGLNARITRFFKRSIAPVAALALLTASTAAWAAVDMQFKTLIDTPDPVAAGGYYNYNVQIENSGTDTAANARFSFPLPASLQFDSATTSLGSCTYDAGTTTVNCAFGALQGTLAGGPVVVLSVRVKAIIPGPAAITATATLATDSPEVNTLNNNNSPNTTIINGADLTFQTFSAAPSPVVAGGTVNFQSVVQNLGPNAAVDASIQFTLAVGLQFQAGSVSGSGWSCTPGAGQLVNCTYASSINSGANAIALSWSAKVNASQVGTLATTAQVSSTTADGDLNNNSASASVSVVAGTDLEMVKSVSADPVIGGQPMTFGLQVNNLGPFPADTLVVTDTIPAGFTGITASGGASWSCGVAGSVVTCTRPALAVGSAPVITVSATAPLNGSIGATGTASSNSASVSSATTEAFAGNNTGTVNFTLKRDGVDMVPVNLSRGPEPVAVGSNVTTTFAVRNDGPRAATGIIRGTFQLAAGETFVSAGGGGWGVCTQAAGLVTCERSGPLAVGATTPDITIISTATAAGSLSGTACVSQGAGLQPIEGEINPGNDCTNGGVTATSARANLALTKSVAPTSLTATATDIVYTLVVTNNGPDAAQNVRLTDPLPMYTAAYTAPSGGVRAATGVSAVASGGGTCTNGSTVICDWTSIPNTQSRTVTITVSRPMADGNWTNTASVYASGTGDPDRSDNVNTANVTIAGVVDLELSQKSANPDPVKAGVNLTYTIQVRNLGPSTANLVRATDTFTSAPGGFTFVSASASDGGTCGAYNSGTMAVACDWGSIESTGVRSMSVVVRPNHMASPPSPRKFLNSAAVALQPGSTSTETRLDNNDKSLSVDILPADIDLKIEQTDLQDPVGYNPGNPPGNLIVYKFDVTNNGPSYATGVQFTDTWTPPTVGKSLTYLCDRASAVASSTCATTTGPSICSVASPTITCPIGDMAATTTQTRYVIYQVMNTPLASGDTYQKLSIVAGNEPETLMGNNQATPDTTVRLLADIEAVSKVPSVASVTVNQPFTWTLNIRNKGPSTALNTTVADTLPSNMVLTGAPVPSTGTCTGGSGDIAFTCALGDLANGATPNVVVPVKMTTMPAGGTITNEFTVATDSVDIDIPNNKKTGTITVTGASLAGSVYIDTNDDGTRQVGEVGIPSIRVTLTGKDAYGNDLLNVFRDTDGSGNYSFTGLPPSGVGGYTLTEGPTPGYLDGKDNKGGTVVPNSKGTDVISGITLASGDALTGYTFGELSTASIAGRVWYDRTNNGLIDGGEATFIGNVRIDLTGTDDLGAAVSANTLTNGSGAYSFTGLRPGTYALTETQPAAYLPGRTAIGTLATGASGTANNTFASPDFGNQITGIGLQSGNAAIEYNFGEIRPGSLAGTVYYDANNSNTQDTGEPGIPTVTVTLTGVDYRGNTITPIVVQTNGQGQYSFPTVLPGTYLITETQPTDYVDGQIRVGSLLGTAGANTVTGIVMPSEGAGTGYDFGERSAGLSGYVYDDVSNDGIKQAGELGIPSVGLALNGCGITRNTLTDGTGYYIFPGLPACATGYTVVETQPSAYSEGITKEGSAGGTVTLNTISNIVLTSTQLAINNNFGEHNRGLTNLTCSAAVPGTKNIREPFNWLFTVRNTTTVGAPASTFASTLPAGLELTGLPTSAQGTCTGAAGTQGVACALGFVNGMTSVIVTAPVRLTTFPTGGTLNAIGTVATEGSDTTADNSCNANVLARQATLAGTVFEDPNNDGIKQTTEVGIANVLLRLTGIDLYNNPVNVPATTLADGTYKFLALAPSNAAGYTLTETQPTLFADGKDTVGSVLGNGTVNDVVSGIVLNEGIDAINYNFGEISQGLAGSVYVDSNDNGTRDPGERGIANVTVRVTGVSSTNLPVDVTTTTDADGNYLFGGLPPSNPAGYTVVETQPVVWADGRDKAGTVGGTVENDKISRIVLPAGRLTTGYDFGEKGGRICGYVYNDLNNNGIKNANETGIPDVVLRLTGLDANGAAVDTTVTTQGLIGGASDVGRYCFVDLPVAGPAGYTIVETQPVGINDGRVTAGTLGGTAGTNTITGIPLTTAGSIGDRYNFGELSTVAASLSGFVYLDSNHDRARNEPTGRNGWTVELVRGDIGGAYTVIATTTTNPDGSYRFDGLPPGSDYSVLFRSPAGNYVYGYMQNITLTAATELAEQNQPIDPSGVVYDVLTRQPVTGATVRLVGPAGFNPVTNLVGGAANVAQVTGPTGEYRYLLLPGSPVGVYRLEVTVPAGYVQRVSTALPPCTATLQVGAAATPSLVQRQDTAPPIGQRILDPATCPATTGGLVATADTTQYYLAFLIGGTSTHVINNHIPIEATPTTAAIIVTKSTPKIDVMRGELVPYVITVRDGQGIRHTDIALVDMIPPGFKYRTGSATIAGVPREPVATARELRWPGLTIERNQTITVKLMLVVGTGVAEGDYVNQVWAADTFSTRTVSNVATATVRIVPDPNFDCSDIIGKVFDDKNRNGFQEEGEPGLANVRLATVNGLLVTTDAQGRFHVTCADVPNASRGSNFVMKIDERTLPTGYRLTTPNPGSVVLTRGKMAKLNFGASIHRVVRLDVTSDAFEAGSTNLRPQWISAMEQIYPTLAEERSVLRIGYGRNGTEDSALAQNRVRSLQDAMRSNWRQIGGGYPLLIETEVYQAAAAK